MSRTLRSAVVGIVVITAVGTFGASPAGAQVAADEWTSSICSSLTDWASELADLSDSSERPANATPKRVKAVLVGFLGGAVEVSETLVDEIKAAGYPDVENGRAIAAVFTKGVTQARVIFAKAERDAKSLPTTSASKFKARAKLIDRALDRGGKEVENLFDSAKDRYSVPELDRAFDEEPACQKLSS